MYCTICGAPLPDDSLVCTHCGSPTRNFGRAQRAPSPGDTQQSTAAADSSDCDQGVALLLCATLGLFGIHRFYAGKPITGTVWMLCGMAWAFVMLLSPGTLLGGRLALGPLYFAIPPLMWLSDMIRLAAGLFWDGEGRRLTAVTR